MMKKINDLIVVEVPKGAERHRIKRMYGRTYHEWKLDGKWDYAELPNEKQDIIGLLSKMTYPDKLALLIYLDCGDTLSFDEWLTQHNLNTSSDLLFIKTTNQCNTNQK